MKTKVFFTTCLLVLLSTCVFAQQTLTRDEAFKIIKQKGLVDTLQNNVAGSKQIITPNTVIKFVFDSIISPSFKSWFFLIDMYPSFDWGHPCKYVFVNTIDGSLIQLNNQSPVDLPLILLLEQKEPNPRPTPTF